MIGVSPDSVKKHAKFKAKHGFTYRLVSDPEHAVCELYGVWSEKTFMGRKFMGVNRTTFLIDAEGLIVRVFEKVKPDGHAEAVAEAIRAFGEHAHLSRPGT